ncbi:MAG: dUTP diphosphatase [Sulfurimonas sp.]
MDKLLLMLQLQAQLNEATNGAEWTSGITKNKKIINWRRCIYMECAEMIDSFSWKHWKNINQEPDWANLQIEVIDVWHFIISLAIENYTNTSRGTLETLALNVSKLAGLERISHKNTNFADQERVIAKVENLMFLTLEKGELELEALFENFFDLVLLSGLNLETLYRLYVGKNILNQFRQDNGYKEGSYIKVWNGEEDNVVMKKIWEENAELKPDMLYRELTKNYQTLTKN